MWQCVDTDELAADALDDVADQLGVLLGHAVPDGVGDVQRGRAVVDGELAHLDEEVGVGAAAVLGRELDVFAVVRGTRGRPPAVSSFTWSSVMRSFFFMWIGDVAMKMWMRGFSAWRTASQARSTSLNAGAREARDGRALHRLGDGLDRLEVALAGDREPGLDHVDAEARELIGDLELLPHVERDPGRLLAVSQGGVEDLHVIGHDDSSFSMVPSVSGNEKPPRPKGTRRRPRAPGGARS